MFSTTLFFATLAFYATLSHASDYATSNTSPSATYNTNSSSPAFSNATLHSILHTTLSSAHGSATPSSVHNITTLSSVIVTTTVPTPPSSSTTLSSALSSANPTAVTRSTGLGTATVRNRCSYDVWIWSVDQFHSGASVRVPARTQYKEPIRPCNNCGTSIKVSKTSTLSGSTHTQFEYTIDSNMWFDISFVNCAQGSDASKCPGHEMGLAMGSPNANCGTAACAAGAYCPTAAYYVDYPVAKLGLPEPVYTCPGSGTGMDLYMDVCSGQAALKREINVSGRRVLLEELA